jgi:hypothetical protein
MAEPMSSNEIEDVLSSIRRLVAQDLKPADRARLAAVADTAQKLVLAPEQRIEDAAGKFATVRRPSRRAAFPPVDSVLADVAAVDGAPRPSAQSPSLRQFSLGEEAAQREAEARQEAQQAEWREIEARAAAAEAAKQAAEDQQFAAENQNRAAEAEQPVETAAWHAPDHAPSLRSEDYEDSDSYDAPDQDSFKIDPNARLFDVAPNAFDGQKLDTPPEPEWRSSEPTAFDEAEIDHSAEEHEDDRAQSQSLHGTIEPDVDWANAAEARVIAELAGEAVEEQVFSQAKEAFREPNFNAAPAQSAPEVLFDEDVLRAMVQAIFREEMAGPMGERITRNIRKLVRAEVGSMLAAHELE